jgi:hypothetical protein
VNEKRHPWSKFYWADWRSDPRLRMCTLAARGLWMEMLALMNEATPFGHLLVNDQSPTDIQLAVLAGAPPDQVPDLLRELETAGVFSRTGKGVIYSRRMTRDEKKAKKARQIGKTGGNPTLRKQRGNPAWDNPPVKPPDNTQRPDTRGQIPERLAQQTHTPSSAPEVALGNRLLEVIGIDPAKCAWSFAPILGWLSAGYDPEIVIVPTVRDVMRRQRLSKGEVWKPNGLQFFHAAIVEAASRPDLPAPQSTAPRVDPNVRKWSPERWRVTYGAFQETGVWPPDYGPPPGTEGHLGPGLDVNPEPKRAMA